MEIDPAEYDGYELFLTLGRVVSPRPIGWMSTRSEDGRDNVAPYSFVTPVAVDPPVLVFQAAPQQDGSLKDTARNAIDTGAFVYNVVTRDAMDRMNASAEAVEESEFDVADIDREPARTVDAPRVASAPAALECSVREVLDIEGTKVLFGDVEHIAIAEEALTDGLIDVEFLADNGVGHVADADYTGFDRFEKEQPE